MDRNMAWAQHRRGHSLGSGAMREKDEDLALFKDMSKRDKPPFFRTEDQLLDHASLSTKFGGLSYPHSAPPVERRGIGAELLNSDADKTDYDWLMTPPGTPLFPSLDADAPALQHGALINRSLAAIKTSRQVGTAPRAKSPAPNVSRGNPSPNRRPSTPQRPQIPTKQTSINNRPATPTRSVTPSSRPSPQPRPSTPTRQPARPVTPLGARPATPTRRSPTPTSNSSSTRPSTPILRRSTSSPTGNTHIRNPSPTRSTASTATSVATARGLSPARGSSPARGVSPAPSSRGRSPSPSLRAPYPVDASDDIPPNLRTTSDRPSSAQRRAVGYGAGPGEGHPLRRTPSPARSVTSSVTRLERASRGASSDSESSFDTGSQSGVSTHGLLTPERRRMLGRAAGVEYGRSSSLQQKARRSGSTASPQLAPSASKKSFESAAREYHRGQVAAFRPLMTNSSISAFYSSRASGLLRRPLTPSSTCSSSEHGATVAHDSDEDPGSSSQWKPSTKASGAHSPLHLFDKSLRDSSTLDASCSIVDDNDEISSFFRSPGALRVESMTLPVASHCKVDELESPEFVSELDWLNSRNAHELDRELLQLTDIGASISKQDSKQGSSGLSKIRDKLRLLKSTVADSNEDVEAASRAATALDTSGETNIVDDEEIQVELLLQKALCEVCGYRKRSCHCSATTTATTSTSQAHEGSNERPSLAEGSSLSNVESAETDAKAANMVYAKERDIWYIYRHSSEYEVPVAGFSETKMEVDPPQILAKEVHMRVSPTSVSAQRELAREDTSPPTVHVGKSEHASSKLHKENVTTVKVSMEVSPCGEFLVSETGNAAQYGKEVDGGLAAIGAADVERKGLEVGTPTIPSLPYPEGVVQNLKQAPYEPERAIQGKQSEKESSQACSSSDNVRKPLHMSSEPPENSQMPALQYSSSVTHRANTISSCVEAEKKLGPATSQGGGPVECGVAQDSPVNRSPNSAEEQSHFRPEFSSSRSVKEEASEQGLASACTVEVHWNEDHASVIPQVKKIIWQEEDLQQFGSRPEAGTVHSKGDEHERTCREGDEAELGWENGKVEDIFLVAGYHREGSAESQCQVAVTHGPVSVKPKTTSTDDSGSLCFEPLELVGQKYLLTGEVHVDSALYAAAHLSDDSLVIKVLSSDGRVLGLDNPARLVSEPNDINSYAVYEYSHSAEVGAQLTFSAHYGREENSSSEIVFYPRERQVHVTTDEKQPRIPEFQGRLGTYTKGSVVPALDSAQITVVAEKNCAAGGLKSGEIAVTNSDGECVAGPLSDDTTYFSQASSAGFHPSGQRNPEPLLNVPEDKETQSKADGPALEGNADAARTGIQEVQVGNVTSHIGDLPPEVGTYNAVDPGLGASSDETTSTDDHIDYNFDCLGFKGDARSAQPAVPDVLMPGAKFLNSAVLKPSSFNGVTQSTNGSDRRMKEKTPPRSQSQSRDTNTKCTSRADSELPVAASQGRDNTTKRISCADSEHSVVVRQSWNTTTTKCTSTADSELPVAVSQSRDATANKSTSHGDFELSVMASQSRDNPTRCISRADFASKSKVAVEAPVKEEIVESADSPSPGTTRKHMSSFKFSHKKASPSELKRSNTAFSSSTSAASKLGTQHQSDPVIPGSKKSINYNKLPVNGKPASPHLNKGRSVRAASPARPPPNARPATPAELPGANGEVPPEEPSIHSRFSNITVRSGSDTENFDWGPSSLEETSSRCGSSSGTNAASMAVLSRSPSSSLPRDSMANGDHAEEEADEGESQTSPSAQSSVLNPRDSIGARRNQDGSVSSPSSESTAESSFMQSHHPTGVVRPHHGPTSVNNNNNNNYAPKQNLDKLSEKLEQLETFGARVLLRNPQQQFLRSPPRRITKPESRSWQPAVVNHPKLFHVASCNSSRSHGAVRLDPHSARPNMCRCTIL